MWTSGSVGSIALERWYAKAHTNSVVPEYWPRLPRRVIDVGPADGSKDPCLLEVSEQHQPPEEQDAHLLVGGNSQRYVALSYCWGNQPTLTMTKENLESMRNRILMASIPRTIRDAIIITRHLGIQFLWVDALCILQGSDEVSRKDWETECAKIGDVYSRAYLTIAAALAPDTHHGIFTRRADPILPNVIILYNSSCTLGVIGHVSLGLICPKRDVLTEPLARRGWAFQERLLSPRVFTYTTDQFAWECQNSAWSESGPWERANIYPEVITVLSWTTVPINVTANNWVKIVRGYTACSLTFEDDKLPALSGLASVYADETHDQYLAGLWKRTLHYQLLWMHNNLDGRDTTRKSRPRTYRAPSWSWASLDGNVSYPEDIDFPESTKTNHCSLVVYKVELKGSNQFGQVTGGWIKLKGIQWRVLIVSNAVPNSPWDALYNWVNGILVGRCWLDMGGLDAYDAQDVWCLRVRGEMGLILTHLRGVGANYQTFDPDPDFGHLYPDGRARGRALEWTDHYHNLSV
jgi:hypothetical protein